MTKSKAIKNLRIHLVRLFNARYEGTLHIDFSEHRGFIDGYINALEDMGVIGSDELLKIIAEERTAAAQRAESAYATNASISPAQHFA